MELKQAAFRNLDYDQLLGFFGIRQNRQRLNVYATLEKDISPGAKEFWRQNLKTIKKGLLMNGRYEKFIKLAGLFIRLMQGRRKIKAFFSLPSTQAQEIFYAEKWDNGKWKWLFRTMFNKKRLAKRGLNADYFHFDDGSASFSESFYRRATHAMTKIPAESNYFLSLYLTGRYLNEQQLPPYLKRENFEVIKQNINRIEPITADSKYWLMQQPENLFDAMSLSNICELMDENDTVKLFKETARTAKPGGSVIFRNLIIPRDVPPEWIQTAHLCTVK
jgi:S-adenosylmethionine-diacylglycerol 3-amino-3-carboxypropyl transferase